MEAHSLPHFGHLAENWIITSNITQSNAEPSHHYKYGKHLRHRVGGPLCWNVGHNACWMVPDTVHEIGFRR
jgi:hypothetical protein